MKLKKSITSIIMVCILLLAMLTACGGGTGNSGESATSLTGVSSPGSSEASVEAARGEVIDGVFRFHDKVTISAVARYNATHVQDPNNLWLYRWAKEKMNIEFVITGVPADSVDEQNSLRFASKDLPDVFLNWTPLTTLGTLSVYGDMEKQLVPINDYITPGITPNLVSLSQELPHVIEACKTLAGNMYGFPRILQRKEYTINLSTQPYWYDPALFAAVGYTTPPKTLDEFLDCLRKIKAQDPGGAGKELIPLGCGIGKINNVINVPSAAYAIWDALGFVLVSGSDNLLATRGEYTNNSPVFLAADPVYYEYLKYMNTLYGEKLIDPDIYTLDGTQVNAKSAAGYNAVVSQYDNTNLPNNWNQWKIMEPMTSRFNETKRSSYGGDGGLVYYAFITSTCKDVEAVMRFMDVGYSKEFGQLYYNGPQKGVDDTYGLVSGWERNTDGVTFKYADVESGKFASTNAYTHNISPFAASGNKFDRRTDGSEIARYDPNDRVGLRSLENINKVAPYLVRQCPGLKFDADTSRRLSDLSAVLIDYIETETAKFITGARPVTADEFAQFTNTMKSMGMEEYMEINLKAFNEQLRK
jgi:putative aldouronate transport system substrate-binding protein